MRELVRREIERKCGSYGERATFLSLGVFLTRVLAVGQAILLREQDGGNELCAAHAGSKEEQRQRRP